MKRHASNFLFVRAAAQVDASGAACVLEAPAEAC